MTQFVVPQFRRFLIVGGLCTALQYAVLITLVRMLGVAPVLASTVGYVLSALANYDVNYRFTFRSRVAYLGGLARFAFVTLSGLALNAFVMAAGMRLMALHYVLSQVLATGAVLLWNFYANRRWTF